MKFEFLKGFLQILVVGFVGIAVAVGLVVSFYVLDTQGDCRKYSIANPDIEFNWSFDDGCYFYLEDGTLQTILDYEYSQKYELEIEK